MGMRSPLAVALVSVCLTLPAAAEEPAPPETPWSKGVTSEQKAAAEGLLADGNALMVQNQALEAVDKYRAAIAQWDHPAIHFNLVRALLALDRPLEAQDSLDKALAYGQAPLGELHAEALGYKTALAGRIGTVEIACKQPGVKIKLDGEDVLACPGTVTKRMLPGNHVVLGTKPGHVTETKDVVLVGGANVAVAIQLKTIAETTVYRTRWATWVPWAVAAGGVLVAGGGIGIRLLAQADLDQLNEDFNATCSPQCTRADYEAMFGDDIARIESRSRIGVGVAIGGGVLVAAGVVGVILNRPKPYRKEQPAPSARLVPAFTPESSGVALVGSF